MTNNFGMISDKCFKNSDKKKWTNFKMKDLKNLFNIRKILNNKIYNMDKEWEVDTGRSNKKFMPKLKKS